MNFERSKTEKVEDEDQDKHYEVEGRTNNALGTFAIEEERGKTCDENHRRIEKGIEMDEDKAECGGNNFRVSSFPQNFNQSAVKSEEKGLKHGQSIHHRLEEKAVRALRSMSESNLLSDISRCLHFIYWHCRCSSSNKAV